MKNRQYLHCTNCDGKYFAISRIGSKPMDFDCEICGAPAMLSSLKRRTAPAPRGATKGAKRR